MAITKVITCMRLTECTVNISFEENWKTIKKNETCSHKYVKGMELYTLYFESYSIRSYIRNYR